MGGKMLYAYWLVSILNAGVSKLHYRHNLNGGSTYENQDVARYKMYTVLQQVLALRNIMADTYLL